jgi:hypothetical protein
MARTSTAGAAPKPSLRKHVLITWSDSNAYEEWTWEFLPTERADGSYSTGARQFGEDCPTTRLQGTYRIRTGAALRDAIEGLLSHEVFCDLDWSWSALLRKIKRYAPKLAAEVRALRQQERDAERCLNAAFEVQYEHDRPVREWVNRARWPHSTAHGAGGMVSQVANARLAAGVTGYVEAYLAEHAHLPVGRHDIDQPIGNAKRAEECHAQGNGLGRAIAAPGQVKMTVQFPEA